MIRMPVGALVGAPHGAILPGLGHVPWAQLPECMCIVFPLMAGLPYTSIPGMISVVVFAPAAWWGMWKLAMGPGHRPPHR